MSGSKLAPVFILLALLAGAVVTGILVKNRIMRPAGDIPSRGELIERGLVLIETQEAEADKLYWAAELLSQERTGVVDEFWDRLNSARDRWEVVRDWPGTVVLPRLGAREELPHGIHVFPAEGQGEILESKDWRDFASQIEQSGWKIERAEFRHNQFDIAAGGKSSSVFYFAAHLVREGPLERAILEGDLRLNWDEAGAVIRTDASGVELRSRAGRPPFERILHEKLQAQEGSFFIDPLIVRDLDGDGVLEIIIVAKNRVYSPETHGAWATSELCDIEPRLIFAGIISDFDGDGLDDLLCADFEGLLLYSGTGGRSFPEAPRRVWNATPRLRYAQALTCGDVDGDGDLDLFLGQYKVPYHQGQMPVPYFDANDGHPSFLLVNDGAGVFKEVTREAGLSAKRFRRVYSASFADLDNDGDLDLLVVSDFAGVDAWINDGSGHFTFAEDLLDEPFGFGMSHAFADFNRDGSLDILMIGMNSPTADRLDHLGLARPYPVPDAQMRARITHGNRLWLGNDGGGFSPAPLSPALRRTGWSWGAAAADFDNDGQLDLYVVNGHDTRQSVAEYEPEFWLHDIYLASSQENALAEAYFQQKSRRTRGRGYSYGGYERNRFFLGRHGTNFVEVAHLLGLGLGEDSRNVLAEDMNGDGRLDLILTTFEVWPVAQQTLQVFENRFEQTGHWVGVQLDHAAPGTKIWAGGRVQQRVTGESYRSQSSRRVHFGLGQTQGTVVVEIQEPGGSRIRQVAPVDAIGRVDSRNGP